MGVYSSAGSRVETSARVTDIPNPKMQSYPDAESMQHKRQLIFVFRFGVIKSGDRDSEQPYRLLWRHQLLQQFESQAGEIARRIDDEDGPAAGDQLEIGKFHLERRRPAPRARGLAVTPNLLDQRLQFRRQSFVVYQVLREGVLGADRFADTVGADGALVDAPRNPVIAGAGLAEISGHELERLVTHIHAREDTEAIQFRAGRRADPMEFADGEILNETRTHIWRDNELSVRLAVVRGELRQELVVGDAGGGGQTRLAQDFRSDHGRDLSRARDALDVFSDV